MRRQPRCAILPANNADRRERKLAELDQSELNADAEALIEAMTRPKRRARPRLAEPLREAVERDVTTDFGRIRAWRLGRGPAVLLLHGWDDDNSLWSPLIGRFAERGRAVVVIDLPGHGFSTAEDPSLAAACAAVLAVAGELGPIDALVGHSFGAVIITRCLAEGLPAKRVGLVGTPTLRAERRWERARRAGTPEDVIARAAEIYAARAAEFEPRYDIEAAAATMTVPALFLHALDDEQCPVAETEALCRLWPGAKIALGDGLGHRLIAQDPMMMKRIVDFIDADG